MPTGALAPDHGIIANENPLQHHRARADPHVVADFDCAIFYFRGCFMPLNARAVEIGVHDERVTDNAAVTSNVDGKA